MLREQRDISNVLDGCFNEYEKYVKLDAILLQLFRFAGCCFNPLNAELNPICYLLALLGGATIVVISRLRVKAAACKPDT